MTGTNEAADAALPEGLVICRAEDAKFVDGGLRSFFEYRRINLGEITGGRVNAHILRAREAHQGSTGRHYHTMESELVYVIRGTNRIEFEGVGIVELKAGDFLHVPKGTVHNVLGFSDDLEVLTIQIPAKYDTVAVE